MSITTTVRGLCAALEMIMAASALADSIATDGRTVLVTRPEEASSRIDLYDAPNDTRPARVQEIDVRGTITGLAFTRGLAMVSTTGSCRVFGEGIVFLEKGKVLQKVSAYDPPRPRPECIEGQESWSIAAFQPVLQGSLGYAGTRDGLLVFDLTDPPRPRLLATMDLFLDNLAIDRELMAGTNWYAKQIRVLKIDARGLPAEAATINLAGRATGVALKGTALYVTDAETGFSIYDLSDPARPLLRSTLPTGYFAFRVVISGSQAYLADVLEGLRIVDVSRPEAPALLGSYATTSGGWWDVAVAGTLAYLPGNDALTVLDARDPTQPRPINQQ